MAVDMTAPAGRRILFTASTWSHLANFHRPYLRALADRGYLVDGACGGAVPMCISRVSLPGPSRSPWKKR